MGYFTLIFLDRQLMQVFEFCPFSYQLGENGERAQRWWSETKKLLIIKTNKKLCFTGIAELPCMHQANVGLPHLILHPYFVLI